MNDAMTKLTSNKVNTDATFDSGHEPLNLLDYSDQAYFETLPANLQPKEIILIEQFSTPIGPLLIGATQEGVCLVEFIDRKDITGQFRRLEVLIKAKIAIGENEHIFAAKKQLTEYFLGQRKQFDLTLFMPGTTFQQQVWQCLTKIKYGTLSSYQQQASNLENPKAIRAMASANGKNRISIIVPCHRVIGKNGSLTGYAAGLARKEWLLEHEKQFTVD